MEKTYWIRRQRDALTMARDAATSEARLTHYELAGRYSIRAAHSLPSTLPNKRPSTGGTDPAPLATPVMRFNDTCGKREILRSRPDSI